MVVLFPGQDPAFQPGSTSSPSPTTFNENLRPVENNYDTHGGEPSLPCLGHLKKLFSCKTVRVVPPEHAIYSQGDSPHTVCLICSGLVKLTRTESDGNQVIVGLRQRGWMLGAVSLLLNARYETTAATITRSKLCFVPAETFTRVMDTSLEFSRWILMILSRGLRSSMLSIGERSCLSGRQRLEKFLWEVVEMQNGIDHHKTDKDSNGFEELGDGTVAGPYAATSLPPGEAIGKRRRRHEKKGLADPPRPEETLASREGLARIIVTKQSLPSTQHRCLSS